MKTQEKVLAVSAAFGAGFGVTAALLIGLYWLLLESSAGNGVAIGVLMMVVGLLFMGATIGVLMLFNNMNMRQDAQLIAAQQDAVERQQRMDRAERTNHQSNEARWKAYFAEQKAMAEARNLIAPPPPSEAETYGIVVDGNTQFEALD